MWCSYERGGEKREGPHTGHERCAKRPDIPSGKDKRFKKFSKRLIGAGEDLLGGKKKKTAHGRSEKKTYREGCPAVGDDCAPVAGSKRSKGGLGGRDLEKGPKRKGNAGAGGGGGLKNWH